MEYYGYVIHEPSSGGKAGKGFNKTTTIQVRKPMRNGYLIIARWRVKVGDQQERLEVIEQAKKVIEGLINPIKVGRAINVTGHAYDLYVSVINGQKFYNAVLTGSWTPGPGGYPDYAYLLKVKGLPADSFSKLNW